MCSLRVLFHSASVTLDKTDKDDLKLAYLRIR